MKIKFLGAAGTVTGSSYLLTSNTNESILIDAGMFQGTNDINLLNYKPFEINSGNILGVVLTHAHLDHCGRLPLLTKNGFSKAIWATPPTRDITEISLYDTAKITKNSKDGPLYTADQVDGTISLFKTVEYDSEFSIGPFRINFKDAGHIIGSASVEIIDTTSPSGNQKIVFSGDLGNSPQELIKPTEPITLSDFVVMESTYGDRFHPNEHPEVKLQLEINKIEETGGVLLIPAFSIERSQEVLHLISHLKSSGKVKNETEVVFDGPMGDKVTKVFLKYRSYFNKELTEDWKNANPFSFPGLNDIQKYQDSLEEVATGGPKVVIAGSGMMSGGRILEYAMHFLPIPTTRILFVGYQAVGTTGRQILEGQKVVKIKGISVFINGTVSEVQAMSSHADQSGLLSWLKAIKRVKKVILTHGEDPVRSIFADKIKEKIGVEDVVIPKLNDEVEI